MALKSIKNKISTMAGGEILGEGNMEREQDAEQPKEVQRVPRSPKPASPKPKNTKIKNKPSIENNNMKEKVTKGNIDKSKETKSKEIKPKEKKIKEIKPKEKKIKENQVKVPRVSRMFGRKEKGIEKETIEQMEEFKEVSPPANYKKNDEMNIIKDDAIKGYEDILSMLGIKEHIELDVDFKSDQLDYVEFTQTQPLGFDFEEVTDFIFRTKYTLFKLESALAQRDRDIIKIASEVKRVEQKMIDTNEEKELERMIGGMTPEEILLEKNMNLKTQINDLTRKLNNISGNSESIKELNKQIEVLHAENDMLKIRNVKGKSLNKLPSMDELQENNVNHEDKDDEFGEMLNAIGGLYDE